MDQVPKLYNAKCKLLLLPIERAMREFGVSEVKFHAFLTFALSAVISFTLHQLYSLGKRF
jgi:hypothetical protein